MDFECRYGTFNNNNKSNDLGLLNITPKTCYLGQGFSKSIVLRTRIKFLKTTADPLKIAIDENST